MKQVILLIIVFFLYINGYCQDKTSNDLEVANYIKKAESFIKTNDFKNAIVNYTAALSHASDKLGIYEKRSIVYLADKNYEDALLDYSKIIELEQEQKKLGSAYFYRGLCKIMLHQLNDGECEDLSTAKKLGFEAEWKKFTMFCPFIAD